MSRINTNVSSMLAQRILGQNNFSLTKSLERLSTGLAINRGSDNPAGLIASEKLRSEITSIDAAIGNAERADQVINIAEGGLQEIATMLLQLQGLVTETANDAGISEQEKDANQLEVDSILQTIDRIASTTDFLISSSTGMTDSETSPSNSFSSQLCASVPLLASVELNDLIPFEALTDAGHSNHRYAELAPIGECAIAFSQIFSA